MSLLSPLSSRSRAPRRRSHLVPVALSVLMTTGAVVLVGYLLWPTWKSDTSGDTTRLPMTIGATLFNVPMKAIRMKVQRHSGDQERVDLEFDYPSLEPPGAPRRVSAETVEATDVAIDRIFLSIAAHRDAMSPDVRLRTIYPRYLDDVSLPAQDGLTLRAFCDGTPYEHEDLITADAPNLVARCTRSSETPGMCLSERRIDGADLTFRFPRDWLDHWRDVAAAMDRLVTRLHGPHG